MFFFCGCAVIDILKGCSAFIFRVRKSDKTAYVWRCRCCYPSEHQELRAVWHNVVSQRTWNSATWLWECHIWHFLNNLKSLLVVHNTRQYSDMKHTQYGLDFTIAGKDLVACLYNSLWTRGKLFKGRPCTLQGLIRKCTKC